MGPHRESTKVKSLRRIPPLSMHKNGQLYVSINLFTHLFVNFKMDTSCLMSFLVMLFGDPSKDFVFKKWQITHVSLRAAQEIVNVMRKPLYLVNIFDQLETLPTVPLKKVSHDTYKKTHLTQLSRNEFCNLFALGPAPVRVSKRTKMPTQKFQGENVQIQTHIGLDNFTLQNDNDDKKVKPIQTHIGLDDSTEHQILLKSFRDDSALAVCNSHYEK